MKLRQKLAVVLASAMVVTSVPVVTMAASTNTLTKVVMVAENTPLSDATTVPHLKVELDDYDQTSTKDEVFYLQLENATWLGAVNTPLTGLPSGVTATILSTTEAKVVVTAGTSGLDAIRIPLLTKVKSGDAKVSIVNKGNTTVSTGTYVYATTNEKLATVSVGTTIPTLYTNGTIADIVLTEAFEGSFASLTDNTIELTIQNSDFIFADVTGTVQLEYGFAGNGNDVPAITAIAEVTSDEQVLKLTLPTGLTSDSIGQIRIKGLTVKSTSKTPEIGDLTIDIEGKATTTQRDVKVATVADYGNTLSVKDDKAVEIVAGQTEEVEFTLAENVEDSMIKGREVEFKLDKGYFALEATSKKDADTKANILASIESIKNDKVELTEEEIKAAIVDTIVEDGKVIGFTMKMPATSSIDKFIINANISVGLEESGEITLTASGRSIGEDLSKVIVDAKQSVEVKTEAAVLKVGLKGQKAGKITITETDKEMIKKGKNIEIVLPSEKGITFEEAPEVKVTGDLQIGKVKIEDVVEGSKVVGQKVVIPVTRASKTASTIEVSNFVISTDRTVAEGAYDVEIGGEALTSLKDSIEATDFITIGTANTEDLVAANGLAKGTSTFVIGESKYTLNGVEKTMDAASYIQNPGYTMIPVRYVAEAFGVGGNDILFSKGVVTIFAGNRTVQLTNNSDVAVVNGAKIQMSTKVVVKDGRTYAPVGEIARILGISSSWDNTTKTATFTNK